MQEIECKTQLVLDPLSGIQASSSKVSDGKNPAHKDVAGKLGVNNERGWKGGCEVEVTL